MRGLCLNCGRDGHHSRLCPEPRQRAAGGERPYGKGGGKGGQLAMDGSVAPFVLPLLPGPEEPSNSTMGKWKIVIHTVGLGFLTGPKVYMDGQYTGEYFRSWMMRAPGGRWKNRHDHLLPGTHTFQESDARWARATVGVDQHNLVPVPRGFHMWMHFGDR